MDENERRAVFRAYYGLVYTIVQGYLSSVARHEDVEECVSDIFAEVFCKLADGGFTGELKNGIRMIAVRRSIDRFRQLAPKAGKTVPLDAMSDLADGQDTQASAERAETCRILMQCIRELGEPDTTIILQRYYFGMRSPQIAKGLGLTASAVRKRANKALKRLKAALQAHGIKEGAL